MYYAMRASAPSLHRESTDSLIYLYGSVRLLISAVSDFARATAPRVSDCTTYFWGMLYTRPYTNDESCLGQLCSFNYRTNLNVRIYVVFVRNYVKSYTSIFCLMHGTIFRVELSFLEV